jgi:hypothetical protein
MDSLKFHLGPPCPTLLCPAGGPPLKWPYGRFRDGPPTGQAALRPSPTFFDTPRRTCILACGADGNRIVTWEALANQLHGFYSRKTEKHIKSTLAGLERSASR